MHDNVLVHTNIKDYVFDGCFTFNSSTIRLMVMTSTRYGWVVALAIMPHLLFIYINQLRRDQFIQTDTHNNWQKKNPKDIKCRSERTRNYWKLVLACLTTSSSVSLLVDNCFYSMYSMYGVPYAYQKALRLWYDQSDIFCLLIPNQLILFRFCYMHVFTLKGCIISTRWQLYNLKSRKYIMF